MNIARNLERSAFFFPHRPAVIEGDRKISFRQFNQEADRVAAGLIKLNTGKTPKRILKKQVMEKIKD